MGPNHSGEEVTVLHAVKLNSQNSNNLFSGSESKVLWNPVGGKNQFLIILASVIGNSGLPKQMLCYMAILTGV